MPAGVGTRLVVIALNKGSTLSTRLGSGLSLGWAVVAGFTIAAIAGILTGTPGTRVIAADRLQRGAAVLLFPVVALYTGRTQRP